MTSLISKEGKPVSFLSLGTVVSRVLVNEGGPVPPFRHYGVVTEYVSGDPIIVSLYNCGTIKRERLSEFAKGQTVRDDGFWGELTPHQVVCRAYEYRKANYCVIGANCEHFVRHVHGLPVQSKQINFLLLGIVAVFSVGLVLQGKLKVTAA